MYPDLKKNQHAIINQVSPLPTVYTANQWVDLLLKCAAQKRASDIHLESQHTSWKNIAVRIDGLIETLQMPTITFAPQCSAYLKVLAQLDMHTKQCAQEGQFQYSLNTKQMPVTYRISIIPTAHGEKLSLRRVHLFTENDFDLTELGLCAQLQQSVHRALKRRQGFILITGPTGSGKTRTLYALLQQLRRQGQLIYSIEDPIELNLPDITQIEVDAESSFNFTYALKKLLRHDPDVIALGEIRDSATAQLACQAAQTGHLVLASLHTTGAVGAFMRLIELGIDVSMLAHCISLVLTQKLVRKCCQQCPKNNCEYEHCHQGYFGRIGIFEGILLPESEDNQLWKCESFAQFLMAIKPYKIGSLISDFQDKIEQKITDHAEFKRVFAHVNC